MCRQVLPTDGIQSGSKLTADLMFTLSRCPSDLYLLVKQTGVGLADFASAASAPTLAKYSNRAARSMLRSGISIPEVTGSIDMNSLERELKSKCGASLTAMDASSRYINHARYPSDVADGVQR